jgi:uncharacterized protein
MDLTNDFRVDVPVREAWKVLTDVERIAPMLPGAQLQEVEGDEYRGVVKVKVGPITAQYKGAATFVERDEAAGRVVLKASGRDTRGQGNATALITATMKPDGDGTQVSVVTDLTVTGKVAQFGRGVMAEVSSKLLGQFVDALEADIASAGQASGSEENTDGDPSGNGAASATDPGGVQSGDGAAGGASAASGAPAAQPGSSGPRRIDSPEAEPVDLMAVAGPSTAKRVLPVIAVLALLVILLARRRGHGAAPSA